MDQEQLIKTLRRIGWVSLLFLAAIIVLSAVEKREASLSERLEIAIEPLPGGERFIDEQDILRTIDRSFGYRLEGLPIGSINVERLERVLEEDPFIRNADAYIDARNVIHIAVEQRQAMLRIIDNNGLNYYLDAQGFKMPLSRHFTARVLVATGNIPPHVPDFLERSKHSLKDVFQLAEMILADELLRPLIDQVYVSNRGELSLMPKVGDQKIYLGRMDQMADKLENLKIFYEQGMPYEGWQRYASIDVRYRGQVVCRKK